MGLFDYKTNYQGRFNITPLLFILALSFPSKELSLIMMLSVCLYSLLTVKFNVKYLLIILYVVVSNILTVFFMNDGWFLVNSIIFFIFTSPVYFFLATKRARKSKKIDLKTIKTTIEIYLSIQTIFSFVSAGYRLVYMKTLDINFGDAIAGTFRLPYVYKSDASNVIFTSTVMIVLSLYIAVFKKHSNVIIVLLSMLSIIMASVSHLYIAFIISSIIAILFMSPKKVIIYLAYFLLFFILSASLYKYTQPINYNVIIERVGTIANSLISDGYMGGISLKGKYMENAYRHFTEHSLLITMFGLGAGSYSSRAALFCSGMYNEKFTFQNISPLMEENTFPLWLQLKSSPAWSAGSFHYPYNSIISFAFELGIVNALLLLYLFVRFIDSAKVIPRSYKLFVTSFIMISAFIDNYFEYYQVTFIFLYVYFLISNIEPSMAKKHSQAPMARF